MTTKEQLIHVIEQTPDSLLEEVFDFLMFIRSRRLQENGTEQQGTQPLQAVAQKRKPIWEIAEELVADLPPEVLDTLPCDGATNHDHYLYGSPKREE